jgi:hypothetical protein
MTLLTSWESLREFSAMQERMNRMNRLFRESNTPEGPEEALTTTTPRTAGGHIRRRTQHCSEDRRPGHRRKRH